MSLRWMLLCWELLCLVLLKWVLLCWVLLCWVLLCWMSSRRVFNSKLDSFAILHSRLMEYIYSRFYSWKLDPVLVLLAYALKKSDVLTQLKSMCLSSCLILICQIQQLIIFFLFLQENHDEVSMSWNFFSSSLTSRQNKLECLSKAKHTCWLN